MELLATTSCACKAIPRSCAAQGAVDDLDRVLAILEETGYTEERFYIHCDGALFGLMVRSMKAHMPFPALCSIKVRYAYRLVVDVGYEHHGSW